MSRTAAPTETGGDQSSPAERHDAPHTTLILGVLAVAGSSYALMQSLVVPALPVIQRDLHTTTAGVAWVFTAYLLSASVATPIAGRLGDMFGKKRVLVISLIALSLGLLLAAVVHTLPLMIVARTIQGFGGALFPLSFGIIRDEFPPHRIAGAIALISGLLGVGAGVGIMLGGPILQALSYHWLFWIPLVVTLLATAATIVVIPESPVRAPGDVHWLGAALLSGWLVALLLGVSEAPTWGWGSPKVIGLLLLAVLLAVAWVWAELRAEHPLVDMHMMRLPGVWTTNVVALLVGFGMYSSFVLIPEFVQTPRSTGYGFGASVTQSGLFLFPSSLLMMISSPIGGRIGARVGSRVPLLIGVVTTMVSFLILSLDRERWLIYVASAIMGMGIGLAFAALPNLIVEAVRRDQTAVAGGMNAIVRTIGGAIGSEVAASILSADRGVGGFPTNHGYTVTFLMCTGAVAVGTLAALLVPSKARTAARVALDASRPVED